jgi:hypothetical protein
VKIAIRLLLSLLFPATMVLSWLFVPQFVEGIQVKKAEVNSRLVSVEPLPLKIYCPGPLVEVGGPQGTDLGSLELIGKTQIFQFSSPQSSLEYPALEALGGVSFETPGSEQSTGLLVANQAQQISRPRASGLAATNCPQPQSSGWFATGISGSGAESVLFLANPNQTEVQVSLEFRLPTGIVEHGVTLAKNESSTLSLAAFSDAEPNYAIRYYTDGPKISMALQNRSTRGLTPTGIELQSPIIGLQTNYVITGLTTYAVGFESPTLVLFNPGDSEFTVSVRAAGQNVQNLETSVLVPARGSATRVLDLVDGSFALFLEADGEFLAAVRNTTLEPALDFAWLTPAEKFSGLLVLPVPNLESTLFLANDENEAVSVTVESINQGVSGYQTILVRAKSGLSLKVEAQTLRLQSEGSFYAALEIVDTGGYAVIEPRENRNLGEELLIQLR